MNNCVNAFCLYILFTFHSSFLIINCKCKAFTHLEATPGFEPGNRSFADSCLTTWLYRHIIFGAGNGAQTRDLCLGKAALYQLSYSRTFVTLI